MHEMNWALISVITVLLVLTGAFRCFEAREISAKEVALIATMATFAAVARIPFAFIINMQPTTFIIMITGYVFGVHTGFMVGALSALVSNIFLGQGPWTPWQMLAWGLAGAVAGCLTKKEKTFNYEGFLLLTGFWGYAFGWIMNLWHWLGFIYPLSFRTFTAVYLLSFPFDTLHALGNVMFTILFGRSFYQILWRYKRKIMIKRI